MEPGSILREPLMGALVRYPNETMDYFMSDTQLKDAKAARFMAFMLKHENGQIIRDTFKEKIDTLILMLSQAHAQMLGGKPDDPALAEIQFSCISLVHLLVKRNREWIRNQVSLINALKTLWNHDMYHDRHYHGDHNRVDYSHWKEPKLVVKILLEYFKLNPDTEIILLFYILRALCGRYVADFQFLKDYLEHEICDKSSVGWKRLAFFEFIRLWKMPDSGLSQDLKAKILQYIIIPAFANSFEKGETDAIIGSTPSPETDSDDNIVSSFISNIIETGDSYPTSDAVSLYFHMNF